MLDRGRWGWTAVDVNGEEATSRPDCIVGWCNLDPFGIRIYFLHPDFNSVIAISILRQVSAPPAPGQTVRVKSCGFRGGGPEQRPASVARSAQSSTPIAIRWTSPST